MLAETNPALFLVFSKCYIWVPVLENFEKTQDLLIFPQKNKLKTVNWSFQAPEGYVESLIFKNTFFKEEILNFILKILLFYMLLQSWFEWIVLQVELVSYKLVSGEP